MRLTGFFWHLLFFKVAIEGKHENNFPSPLLLKEATIKHAKSSQRAVKFTETDALLP